MLCRQFFRFQGRIDPKWWVVQPAQCQAVSELLVDHRRGPSRD
jgi:hypothetical protein